MFKIVSDKIGHNIEGDYFSRPATPIEEYNIREGNQQLVINKLKRLRQKNALENFK